MKTVTVLVAEDEGVIALDLTSRLTDMGYRVCGVATSGAGAVEKAGETQPDVVLMDVILAGTMDGVTAADRIRRRFDIPVVYLTGHSDDKTLKRVMTTEPYGYVLKPFDDRELRAVIEMAIYKHRLEKRLKESERWMATTLKSVGDGLIATDLEGRVQFMNPVAETLTGWTQAEALGRSLADVFQILRRGTPADAQEIVTWVLQEGAVPAWVEPATLIARGGSQVPIDDSVAPIHDEQGHVMGIVLVFRDTSERQQAEESLRAVVDNIEDGLLVATDGGACVYANERAAEITGFAVDELLGLDVEALVRPDERRARDKRRRKPPGESEARRYETFITRSDGTRIPVEIANAKMAWRGRPASIVAIRNITERRRADAALRKSEQRYRALFASTQRQARELALIDRVRTAVMRELELPVVLCTVVEAVAQTFGYTYVSIYLLEHDVLVLQHQVGYEQVLERTPITQGIIGRVARTGQAILLEDVRSDAALAEGLEGIVSAVCVPLFDQDRVVGVLNAEVTHGVLLTEADLQLMTVLSQHISIAISQARLYTEVRKSERKYRSVVDNIKEVIFQTDAGGLWTFLNPSWTEITGYAVRGSLGKPMLDFVHPDERQVCQQEFDLLTEGQAEWRQYELRFLTQSGHSRWFGVHCWPIVDAQDRVIGTSGILNDVTERRQAEENLRESEERYRSLVEISPDAIVLTDLSSRVVLCNQQAATLMGYDGAEEVAGKALFDSVVPEDRQRMEDNTRRMREGAVIRSAEYTLSRKDGTRFLAELRASLVPDAQGQPTAFVAVIRDITERKRAEEALRRWNRELMLLNRSSRALLSTLNLDLVLATVLEEVRHLLDVVACSVWLVEPKSQELVCRQATGPQNELLRGWRLPHSTGIVGWVAASGESSIVADVLDDDRYYSAVDEHTRLNLRSILSVPLHTHKGVAGVIQAVDTKVGRFDGADLMLMEALATTAGMAIDNARMYEQALQDAEVKAALLREANHRVKNNLSAIIGLLYAERRHAGTESPTYEAIMQDLINRVQGLATVHSMLSLSRWQPLLLSELATRMIHSALQTIPPAHQVSVDVSPSGVRVTADQAHNLALIMNELATNTAKHVLRERGGVCIQVRIGLTDHTIVMEFRDDGPGYTPEVLEQERYHTGLDLVRRIVTQGLHGELSLRNDRGAVAVVRLKQELQATEPGAGDSQVG